MIHFRKIFLGLAILLVWQVRFALAQSVYLPPSVEEIHLLKRIETKTGRLSNRLFIGSQPVSRIDMYHFLAEEKSSFSSTNLTNADFFLMNRGLALNQEYQAGRPPLGQIQTILLRKRVQNTSDLFRYHSQNFHLVINPVIGATAILENQNQTQKIAYYSAQGIDLRGGIFNNRMSFAFTATNNIERPVSFFDQKIKEREAIPNAGMYQNRGDYYHYLLARGYVDVALIQNHIHLTLGYDKHFIGNGMRSLFLSDYSEAAAFARLSTKVWRLQYQNYFMKLQPQSSLFEPSATGNKYAVMHHLSMNLTHWLNIGLYENVIFSRHGGYEIGYLNPIIFYRAVERNLGSPDKVTIGMDAKALVAKKGNIYAQFLLNEFTASKFFSNKGYWANKWGLQMGFNYYDVLGIDDLDLQGELNMVKPYTYQHSLRDSTLPMNNYTHFNQELAHPLGAGFREWIGIMKYRPRPWITIEAKAMYYENGIDTGNLNFGNDIFHSYRDRASSYGVGMIHGLQAQGLVLSLHAGYEVQPGIHLDLGVVHRNTSTENNIISSTLYFYTGFRWGLNRRDYTVF